MPEGDTIYRTARTLHLALSGQAVTGFKTELPKLARVALDREIEKQIIEKVQAQGKWLLIYFSSDLILLTHMLMHGSWHIYRPGERWKRPSSEMRIVIETEKIMAVAFRVQVAEFHTPESLRRRPGFNNLGPQLLSASFDEPEVIARMKAQPTLEIADALLRQSLMAGIGNLYKSEICFACGVNPFDQVMALDDPTLARLVSTGRKLLVANAHVSSGPALGLAGPRRTTGRTDPSAALWVYRRTGQPCRRCGTLIQARKQGQDARTTFWCPDCQRAKATRTASG